MNKLFLAAICLALLPSAAMAQPAERIYACGARLVEKIPEGATDCKVVYQRPQQPAQATKAKEPDPVDEAKKRLEEVTYSCKLAAMTMGTHGGGHAEAMGNVAKCDIDPYWIVRPKAPTYACTKDLQGALICSPI